MGRYEGLFAKQFTMSIVTLVSGGLDSTLTALLIKEEGVKQFPLFINYGQLCKNAEWKACKIVHKKYNLPNPRLVDVKGFGKLIFCGLTNPKARLVEDAFLPGRNLLFLIIGAAYAFETNSSAVAIGLLNEKYHLFPDQTSVFIRKTEELIKEAMGRDIRILTPLMKFTKNDVIQIAKSKRIEGTYSCHAGTHPICGKCVSCLEIINSVKKEE